MCILPFRPSDPGTPGNCADQVSVWKRDSARAIGKPVHEPGSVARNGSYVISLARSRVIGTAYFLVIPNQNLSTSDILGQRSGKQVPSPGMFLNGAPGSIQ